MARGKRLRNGSPLWPHIPGCKGGLICGQITIKGKICPGTRLERMEKAKLSSLNALPTNLFLEEKANRIAAVIIKERNRPAMEKLEKENKKKAEQERKRRAENEEQKRIENASRASGLPHQATKEMGNRGAYQEPSSADSETRSGTVRPGRVSESFGAGPST